MFQVVAFHHFEKENCAQLLKCSRAVLTSRGGNQFNESFVFGSHFFGLLRCCLSSTGKLDSRKEGVSIFSEIRGSTVDTCSCVSLHNPPGIISHFFGEGGLGS